jgi:transcriptional regulator with XRE-family HTH domain
MGNNLGEMIRDMRKAAGMSQQRLADQVGVSYQQVQKYENGTSQLNIKRLAAIADAFGVHITTFLDARVSPEMKNAAAVSNLTKEEGQVLILFRRLKRKKLRESFIGMLKDIVKLSEAK